MRVTEKVDEVLAKVKRNGYNCDIATELTINYLAALNKVAAKKSAMF